MAQQTAVQALWDWIDANCHEDNFNINDARDMSLKLEKQQIINAFIDGDFMSTGMDKDAEEYYNETYKK